MRKATTKKAKPAAAAARREANMKESADWRSETLARVRALIKEADPEAIEERKWKKPSNAMRGVPVWSHDGIICTGETYKDKVKLTFANGASLKDPSRLFNASLEGGMRRAIDIRESDKLNEAAFKALIREAAALNTAKKSAAGAKRSRPGRKQNGA